ncbi:MAG: hypothetical protein EBE86_009165 [Hormoscilla sp. GUM202]|nr:hypothetical protein [Hormoscilla sp. GUM202]
MKRDRAIERLSAHATELTALGVKSLALFGSVARDEAREDLLTSFASITLFRRSCRVGYCRSGMPGSKMQSQPTIVTKSPEVNHDCRTRTLYC